MIEFGKILLGEPPSFDIASENWETFVGDFAVLILLFALAGIVLSLWWYKRSAYRTMIHSPTDLFLPYRPLRKPICVALVAAGIAAVTILIGFLDQFGKSSGGMFQTAGRAAGLVAGFVCVISYATILGCKAFTPSKFRYRPKFWLRSAKKPT